MCRLSNSDKLQIRPFQNFSSNYIFFRNVLNFAQNKHAQLRWLINTSSVFFSQADSFQKTSTRVARKYWWKNVKMMIIIGVIVVIALVLIILAATGVI